MRIKFGSIVTDGSGKIGGHVVTKYRGTSVLQTKGFPRLKGKNQGRLAQGLISIFSRSWSNLTDIQRDSWKENSSLSISGFNLYVSRNALASMGGYSPISSFFKLSVLHEFTFFKFEIDLSTNVYTISIRDTIFYPMNLLIYVTRPLPVGRMVRDNDYFFIGNVIVTVPDFGVAGTNWSSFAVTNVSDIVSVRLRVVNSAGEVSNFRQVIATIVN